MSLHGWSQVLDRSRARGREFAKVRKGKDLTEDVSDTRNSSIFHGLVTLVFGCLNRQGSRCKITRAGVGLPH
jgi:hypothetical protein